MAKNKLAKRNLPAPRKGLSVMKLGFDGREEIMSKRFTDVDMVHFATQFTIVFRKG